MSTLGRDVLLRKQEIPADLVEFFEAAECGECHVCVMVKVFREVRRALRSDGVLFLNYGDSYLDKQLVGMPWKIAFALQADGWWLRQDCVWSKPNPMPESVRSRCTKAHEYIFLLSKSPRYFFDAEAIAEEGNGGHSFWATAKHDESRQDGGRIDKTPAVTRNKRSVWTVATAPFSEAHFATFPPALIEPMIRAGTSEKGCCAKCGAPWVRQTTVDYVKNRGGVSGRRDDTGSNNWDGGEFPNLKKNVTTTGWQPSCSCAAPSRPCVVLDCFFGAGTTGLVSDRLGRDCIGIELNEIYAEMARERIQADAGLFAEIA